MNHSKIAIIGAGAVGTTTAYALMLKNLVAEIVLIDINVERCKGEVLDLADALPFCATSKIRSCMGCPQDAQNADIIIIAAGFRQKPGQTRLELLETNKKVITDIFNAIKPLNNKTKVIMITNPVDILTLHAQEISGLPRNQVFGSGTFLDTQRMRGVIAQRLNVAEQSIEAFIMGEHGDSQFPAWSSAHIDGTPLLSFPEVTKKDLEELARETRDRVYQIIACKGATYFGIATCVTKMCEAILFNQRIVIPVSTFVEEYGVSLSVPIILGENGIEKRVPLSLTTEEENKLAASAKIILKSVSK